MAPKCISGSCETSTGCYWAAILSTLATLLVLTGIFMGFAHFNCDDTASSATDTVRHGLDLIIPSLTVGAGAIAGIGAICVGAKKEKPWSTIVLPGFLLLCIVAAGLISIFSDQLFGVAFNPCWYNVFAVFGILVVGCNFIALECVTAYGIKKDNNTNIDQKILCATCNGTGQCLTLLITDGSSLGEPITLSCRTCGGRRFVSKTDPSLDEGKNEGTKGDNTQVFHSNNEEPTQEPTQNQNEKPTRNTQNVITEDQSASIKYILGMIRKSKGKNNSDGTRRRLAHLLA